MEEIFKQMSISNEQIRTLVQENDKLIGAARDFKKGLEKRTQEYQELKKEIDQLRTDFQSSKTEPIKPSLKQKQTESQDQFTIEERNQLLEIIEQQRQEIERLTVKKKKKKIQENHLEETPKEDSLQATIASHQAKLIEPSESAEKPKKTKRLPEANVFSNEKAQNSNQSSDFGQPRIIKPKKKSIGGTSLGKKYL